MTVAGLPGIPGGAALVPALDAFTRQAFIQAQNGSVAEMCGVFLWEPDSVHVKPDEIEWQGHIEFVECLNISDSPEDSFVLDSQEVEFHIQLRLQRMHAISNIIGESAGKAPGTLMLAGYSPLVGVGHSHPGGTIQPSAADHLMSANATAWRRATAPQTLFGMEEDAKFFEADFMVAVEDAKAGAGTLVHFKRGRTEGTWKGNFVPPVD